MTTKDTFYSLEEKYSPSSYLQVGVYPDFDYLEVALNSLEAFLDDDYPDANIFQFKGLEMARKQLKELIASKNLPDDLMDISTGKNNIGKEDV